MKVKKFIVENYKAIKGRKEYSPEGASFFLIGGNGKGKTSAGRAMMDLLTKSLPSKPVTEGEKEGYIEFTFDNGATLYGRLSENGKTKIEFVTGEGIKAGAPKDLLQMLSGDAPKFSIDDFLTMAPKPRREMLEKITGVDFTEVNSAEAEAFEHRKLVKRQLADQQARVQPYDRALVGKDPVDASELNEELEELRAAKQKQSDLHNEVCRLDSTIESIEDEINRLQAKLKEAKDDKEKAVRKLDVMNKVDTSRMDELREKLNSASDTNQAIADANRMHAEFERAKELEAEVDKAEQSVKDIRAKKEQMLRENKLPAEGLEWSEDGQTLMLDGLPFESNQLATSKKVIAGLQIAEALMGKIRYVHFDASILDKKHAAQVLEWAENKDLQLCLERALWEGGELKFEVVHDSLKAEMVEV